VTRQHRKTVGAPLAQTGLLQQRENGTHGVVAGASNNAPPCVGAVLAQSASRASHQTRYAPAALCLRRRSLEHRWSPVERGFRRECQLQSHCLEADQAGTHARAREGWKNLVKTNNAITAKLLIDADGYISALPQRSNLLLFGTRLGTDRLRDVAQITDLLVILPLSAPVFSFGTQAKRPALLIGETSYPIGMTKKDRGRGAVGANSIPRADIDLLAFFRGSSENFRSSFAAPCSG
jgi:hypothetical protein